MIHQLLTLTRPLIVFDTETTGVNPQEDRIVELGFQLWTAEGLQKEWRSLIDPGVPIPESASKVHGITSEKLWGCRNCGRMAVDHGMLHVETCSKFDPHLKFREVAESLVKGFKDCDYAGKNVRFDLRILAAEMSRAGVAWSYLGARIVDAERLEQIAVPRTLSHLYEKYTGKKLDGAHGALADVDASTTVIVKQLEAHGTLPRDLDALHRLQWPGWIDSEGKFKMVDGVPCFGSWGKFAGRPMSDPEVARPNNRGQSYWDFILGGSFPEDVKQLARNAKLGKFPTQGETK